MKRLLIGLGICLLNLAIIPAYANSSSQNAHKTHQTLGKHAQNSVVSGEAVQGVPTDTTEAQMMPSNADAAAAIGLTYIPLDLDVPGQSFVSTGPYIGVPLLYSGGNLIINSPNINEDVTLLKMRKTINERLTALGRPHSEDHSHLLLSGNVEVQGAYINPGVGNTRTDINLSNAELDGYVLGPSNWTSALFAFTYDSSVGTQEGSLSYNTRVANSRLYVDKAFIIVGDFQRSPFYGTAGQMYVPFGTYSSNMISSPLTKFIGRTKERALLLGFQQQGNNAFYGSAYVYKGDSYLGATSRVNTGGINFGYRYDFGVVNGDLGVGAMANIADALGMQITGNQSPVWGGFGASNGNEQLKRKVPATNFHGLFSIGSHIDLLLEYVGAVTNFSPQDLTFNTLGANPRALNAEAAYTFTMFDRPTSVAVGYGRTQDALALGLAWQRYMAVINTSWWKNTLESLEFRHDINYSQSDYATGSMVPTLIYGAGKPDTAITAQFDIYF